MASCVPFKIRVWVFLSSGEMCDAVRLYKDLKQEEFIVFLLVSPASHRQVKPLVKYFVIIYLNAITLDIPHFFLVFFSSPLSRPWLLEVPVLLFLDLQTKFPEGCQNPVFPPVFHVIFKWSGLQHWPWRNQQGCAGSGHLQMGTEATSSTIHV